MFVHTVDAKNVYFSLQRKMASIKQSIIIINIGAAFCQTL